MTLRSEPERSLAGEAREARPRWLAAEVIAQHRPPARAALLSQRAAPAGATVLHADQCDGSSALLGVVERDTVGLHPGMVGVRRDFTADAPVGSATEQRAREERTDR